MDADRYADRCARCGREDVDEQWLWLEARRFGDDDCEFEEAELSFCSQAHAAAYLADAEIDWEESRTGETTGGVRADVFMFGCGLVAIVLSVLGIIALVQWLA